MHGFTQVCTDRGDTSEKVNLKIKSEIDGQQIFELLQMTSFEQIRDSSHQANVIRDALAANLFLEKQTGLFC